jgi:hypothetical protein
MSELAASDVSNKSNGSKVSASPATSGSTDAVRVLDAEMNWLAMLLDAAIRLYFGQPC